MLRINACNGLVRARLRQNQAHVGVPKKLSVLLLSRLLSVWGQQPLFRVLPQQHFVLARKPEPLRQAKPDSNALHQLWASVKSGALLRHNATYRFLRKKYKKPTRLAQLLHKTLLMK